MSERFDTWKEIAAFFRREVRTVQLWEKHEELPVHRQRHRKLGSVFAYRHELETWWETRSKSTQSLNPPSENTAAPPPSRASINQTLAEQVCGIGFHFWNQRTRTSILKSIEYFKDAAALDPTCANAFAGIANSYVSLSYNHLISAHKAASLAYEAVQVAVRVNPYSLAVRNALISVLVNCTWDWKRAEDECQRSIDSGLVDDRTIQLYSSLKGSQGQHQKAIELALQAHHLNPHGAAVNNHVSMAYLYAGDYSKALVYTQNSLELEPQFLMGHVMLGRIEAQRGNWGLALTAFEQAARLAENSLFTLALTAYAHAGGGNLPKALELLAYLEARKQDECFPAYEVSAVHTLLGQQEQALENLSRACEVRDMKTIFMQEDPRFSRLRHLAWFSRSSAALRLQAMSCG
ncbi:MAG TPA: hypothetical protein VGC07_02630 [Granulicella sp.]